MTPKKLRFRTVDGIILLLCIAAGAFIYYRVKFGLEYKGDWSAIPQFLIRFDSESGRWVANYLLQGFITTLKLSIWSTLLAVVLGVIVAICRTSTNLFLRMVGRTYVELIRNLPPLILIFIFYFFVIDQLMPILGIETMIRNSPAGVQSVLTILFAESSPWHFLRVLISPKYSGLESNPLNEGREKLPTL